jgi:hypothetical protein
MPCGWNRVKHFLKKRSARGCGLMRASDGQVREAELARPGSRRFAQNHGARRCHRRGAPRHLWHLPLYAEREGGWVLDVDGAVEKSKLDEFRNTNVALLKERDDLKKRYDGWTQFTRRIR